MKILQAEIIHSVEQLLATAEIQVYSLSLCVSVPKDSKVKSKNLFEVFCSTVVIYTTWSQGLQLQHV